ncbi:EVE domain-containing protein [Intrasporangium flavum]|uniref:EVE domain-containing protein n=1 Tax=Intrasporangium flavum TaxID=1428657 RepID=UPI00096E1991|nr:EVE domain-containing protein [Intrasporangium flavum]
MRCWLGVVSAAHVRRGVELGIAQVHHGQRPGLARMAAGDGFVYYSPREEMGGGAPCRAFTAVGRIADDEIWQADEGDFRPYRRRVDWEQADPVPLAELTGRLLLTRSPGWGQGLRRGLLPLDEADFRLVEQAMTVAYRRSRSVGA